MCVDEYQDSILSGRLYHPCLSEGDSFRSLMEFFRKMEDLLDGMQFPQSFTAVRSFSDPPLRTGRPPGADMREGRCATFAVRVLFRQNASWQGSVSWLEGSREESFRSALELAFLMIVPDPCFLLPRAGTHCSDTHKRLCRFSAP